MTYFLGLGPSFGARVESEGPASDRISAGSGP